MSKPKRPFIARLTSDPFKRVMDPKKAKALAVELFNAIFSIGDFLEDKLRKRRKK